MRNRPFLLLAVLLGAVAFACDDDSNGAAAPPVDGGGTVGSGDGSPSSSGGPAPDAAVDDGGGPVTDGGPAGGRSLSVRTHTTCLLRPGGKVACWGANGEGQLGDGTQEARVSAVEVQNLPPVVQVSNGSGQTCARKADGTVMCWGEGTDGQLGDGEMDAGRLNALAPVAVKGLVDAQEISVAQEHACARRANGSVVCWGRNAFGKIGDGTNETRYEPTPVVDLTDAVELASGSMTCARRTSGKVSCWGTTNEDGELGNGTTEPSRVPVEVVGLTDAVEIAVGASSVCARRSGGTVVCWGSNNSGRLGLGTTDSAAGALKPGDSVLGLTDAVQISVGRTSACAVRATGAVVCWGANNRGQIGNGSVGDDVGTPSPVLGVSDAVEVAVGQWHACARRAAGGVVCWGTNENGQLADGTNTPRSVATPVSGLP